MRLFGSVLLEAIDSVRGISVLVVGIYHEGAKSTKKHKGRFVLSPADNTFALAHSK